MEVGIIGCGVIGGALYDACNYNWNIGAFGYDPKRPELDTFEDILKTELVFLCLPSPTINGKQDIGVIYSVLEKLEAAKYRGTVVLRSTLLPGTTKMLGKKYPGLLLAHNPEFVTAAHPLKDMLEQKSILIGAETHAAAAHVEAFWCSCAFAQIIKIYTDPSVTEMAKYVHNCFLATKVSFFNDIHEMCAKSEIDFQGSVEAAISLEKIGTAHTKVPGPDGKYGFGGMCFVKDTLALSTLFNQMGIEGSIVGAVVERNQKIRPEAYNGGEQTGCVL